MYTTYRPYFVGNIDFFASMLESHIINTSSENNGKKKTALVDVRM
jgi:hypothetical protein